jgi:CDP-diacylglycerol--glycerol-3-phosphate 3-phosphatidyltransferase
VTATKLIALRTVLGVFAAAAYATSPSLAYVGLALFLVATFLDMADGLLAERKKHIKPFGGFLDISADQCIEYLLWIVFLELQLVPIWIPIFIVLRNTFINLLRISAISQRVPMFGEGSMISSQIGRWLVGARLSRGIMVLVKTLGFIGITVHYSAHGAGRDSSSLWLDLGTWFLWGLALVHLVRGVVIVWESRSLLPQFLWSERQAAGLAEASK